MGKDLNGKELGKGFSQRKDGRYEARTTLKGIKIDIYDMNLSKLKKEFEKEKTRILNGDYGINKKITFSEWYSEWFEKCKSPVLKSIASRKAYDRKARNTYVSILGQKRMSEITQLDIQTATNELTEKDYTERTIKEALGIIRECFDIAIVNHIISTNPCVGINLANTNTQHERRVLTKDEQNTFISEVKDSYYYEAYVFLLSTGLRIGEFSGLQWQDIDFVNKQIKIQRSMSTAYIDGKKIEELTTPKTSNSYRIIPFFGETEKHLKEWKKKQDECKKKMGDRWRCDPNHGDLVFTSTVGSPVTRYVIVHDIKKVVQNINMKEIYAASKEGRLPVLFEHVHPHAFRHTFATRCFEKGLDPLFIQSIMGHSNYSTTISYTHILDDKRNAEIQKVGNFLD